MPETLPKTSIIAQFLDEGEPLGTLMLDGTEYKICHVGRRGHH